ncbi:MAG: PD-(D/E)XK nuclease family protein, partial [Coriobacteriia bacterium]|nr:PD-(D/E)XK nuclease family protein [Coriobacteriia bacterium]
QAVPIAAALRTRGFAVLTLGGSRFFGLDETLWLTAFCRTIANPMDDEALLEVLLSPLVDANDDALLYVRSTTDRSEHDHLWEGMEVALSRGEPEHAEVLGRATALVRSARERIGAMPLAEILLRAVEESELDLDLLAQGDEGRERFANILKFARMAEDYERAQGFGPAGFVAHLAAKERFGEHESPASLADEKSPAVRIMSIHKAKGLEFAVVALPRLGQGVRKEADIIRCAPEGEELRVALRIPADWKARVRAAGGSEPKAEAESAIFRELGEWRALEELEEAKRLLYVACTRARDVLLLGGTVRQDKQIPADSPLAWLYSALGDLTELRAGESRRIELRGGSLLQAEIHRIDQSATEAPSGEAVCYAPPGSPAGSATGPSAADAARPARSESGEAWRPRELSYSQIELFRACPRKFWARHVSRVGEPVAGRGPAARDFGSAVHLALQLSGGQPIGDEAASSIAARYGLDLEGRQRLEDAVRAFAESSVARGISAHELLSRETPFAVPLGTGDIVLKGFMDVYARTGDRALVVDYKTGTAGEPDGLAKRYLLQAQCYAYASLAAGTTGVEVVFVRPEVVLEDGEPQVIAYAYGAEHAVGIERELLAVAGEMATGTFPSRDAWDRETCAACPIAGIACDIGASRPRGVA